MVKRPSFAEEKKLAEAGHKLIAGVDEVGRGALAGPLVAAAVILPVKFRVSWRGKVRDSKLLTALARQSLDEPIRATALAYGIGIVSPDVIDREGMTGATRLAMEQAIAQLEPAPDALLIDFFKISSLDLPQKGVKDGDTICFSIACASIIAKVARDRLMTELDSVYPGYGLANHKGYGTAEHLSCLRRLGPSAIHRRSFSPVRDICNLNGA